MSESPLRQNAYGYDVNTTYEPDAPDVVVPSIPAGNVPAYNPNPFSPHVSASQQPAVPSLTFTETTANSHGVSGSISKPSSQPAAPSSSTLLPSNHTPSAPAPSSPEQKYPFYNVKRYRKYFNVDTQDVVWRMTNSVLGPFKADFINTTAEQPDLYGPFWVATTLVFVTAVAGNYANYIAWSSQASGHPASVPGNGTEPGYTPDINTKQWYNDYSKMSYSALIFYGYIFLWGLCLYFSLRFLQSSVQLVNVWCIYGYALTVFIPVSFACVVPLELLRWLLVALATASSGLFLLANFKATIYAAAPARASMLLLVMAGVHAALGLALKLYFFQYA